MYRNELFIFLVLQFCILYLLLKILSISVEVHLQATGDAPIMKQKKYKVDGEKRIDWIIAFIRKFLKLEPTDSLVSNSIFKYAAII